MDEVDAVDVVDAVNEMDEAVEPETAKRVCAPIANLTDILQMHAGSGNALRREETTEEMTSAFASSACSQGMSQLIASPTNI